MRVASTQRRLLLAVLAGVIMLSAGETPRPTQAVETPACGVGDTLTRYRATSDWYRSLLDTRFRLPRAYAPGDLVSVSRAGVGGFGRIRRVALGDFAAMARAARAAARAVRGPVRVPWLRHADLDVLALGEQHGLPASAAGVGTAGPLGAPARNRRRSQDPRRRRTLGLRGLGQDEGRSLAGSQQLALRLDPELPALREPRETCYKYEPWHFRYVGRQLAAQIHASGLTPREWLWRSGATGTLDWGRPDADTEPDAHARSRHRPRSRHRHATATPDTDAHRRADTDAEPDAHAGADADAHAATPTATPTAAPTPDARARDRAHADARGSTPDLRAPAWGVAGVGYSRKRAESLPRRSQITIATRKRRISDTP